MCSTRAGTTACVIGLATVVVAAAAMSAPAMAQPPVACSAFRYQGNGLWTATRQTNVLGTQGSYEVLPGQMAGPDVVVRLDRHCR